MTTKPTPDPPVQVKSAQHTLEQLLPYQRRVQASMERLSVPSWYRTPAQSSLRRRSHSSGWTRPGPSSPILRRSPSLARVPRAAPLQPPSRPARPSLPYLGWRSLASLPLPSLAAGPTERLARTVTK